MSTPLYYPNLDTEELLRVAQDSTDPLVEELVKRLAWTIDANAIERQRNESLEHQIVSLEQRIDRERGLKD
ncbi:MAG TPA: hypothetical protein VFM48_07725 [Aquabacterium sp.]|nr:hypothetical protein [Aquabacterium sp.]